MDRGSQDDSRGGQAKVRLDARRSAQALSLPLPSLVGKPMGKRGDVDVVREVSIHASCALWIPKYTILTEMRRGKDKGKMRGKKSGESCMKPNPLAEHARNS